MELTYNPKERFLAYSTTSHPTKREKKTNKLFPDFLRKSLANKEKDNKKFQAKKRREKQKAKKEKK